MDSKHVWNYHAPTRDVVTKETIHL